MREQKVEIDQPLLRIDDEANSGAEESRQRRIFDAREAELKRAQLRIKITEKQQESSLAPVPKFCH